MDFYKLAERIIELEREGKNIIKLHVGDTNLLTSAVVIKVALGAIKKEKPKYGSAAGLMDFRKLIAEREDCEVENVIVGPGSKHLIYSLMSILLSRGETVATPDPAWPAYELICNQLGLKTKKLKTTLEDKWIPKNGFNEAAKMIIICNPLNPTSIVYSRKWIEKTIKEANESGRGVWVVLDEAYKDLAFEKIPRYDGAIRIRSFSKEFNMEGWRLGYAVAPREIVQRAVKFNQITITCVADFIQKAGMAAIENEKEIIRNNIRIWKRRSRCAQQALRQQGFKFASPDAGIYVFATHERIENADAYCRRALEKGIALAPGSGFGGYKRFFRICLNQKEEMLKKAIEKMGELI